MDNQDAIDAINNDTTKAMNETGRPFSKDEVLNIINSVVGKIEANKANPIYKDLKALADYIEEARREISNLAPIAIGQEYIPSATDELDAVVKSTEEATGKIMDNCETLEAVAEKIGDGAEKDSVLDAVTNIYEACGFQDITGQRISKVVNTLRHIETQVNMIVEAVGLEVGVADDSDEKAGDEALLNGPQMQSQAINQDDIDALLASFD